MQNSKCGAGGWAEDPRYRFSVRVPGDPPTNNRGEVAAVLLALQRAPMNEELYIYTDSTYVLNGLVKYHKTWEDQGWIYTENADIWQATLFLVRQRTAETYIEKVKAHDGIEGNEEADLAAKAALAKEVDPGWHTTVPPQWKEITMPNYKQILGVGLLIVGEDREARDVAATRLQRIVVSETAFAIYKLRNRQVIDETPMPPRRALSTWNVYMKERGIKEMNMIRLPENSGPERAKFRRGISATWEGLVEYDQARRKLLWVWRDHG
ncbi:hypothetical protein M407DRAFT_211133 [Tulasnella calospora MUT 4182]|uniref:ribonuclease H n=1 Tax=Tulasnella calospora MUT 4182 TaxID=1051891 RepID=A0A0C3PZV4_9AGAM|nr:hypothetical protein M407DRAFT_211133 [Tulasnella calospora MUT 4182]